MINGKASAFLLPALSCLVAGAAAAAADRDASIEAAAKHSYNFRVHLKGDEIRVSAKQGAVTLTGSVADGFHKSLAEETVLGLPGVRSVDNQLIVMGEAPLEASDAWLTSKVKAALLYHRNVSAATTHVETTAGVVTLTGEASSAAQKELTGEIAQNVEGVKGLNNDLKLVTPAPGRKSVAEKLDDASVTAQVKATLLFHRGTHLLTTKVKTDRGVVAVRGKAKNPAEKELVTRLVTGVKGVKRVDNRMTIAP